MCKYRLENITENETTKFLLQIESGGFEDSIDTFQLHSPSEKGCNKNIC